MKTPVLYIDNEGCQGSHQGGWSLALESQLLPQPGELLSQIEGRLQGDKLSLLLADASLHPLRISLEEKVKATELPSFLSWKLKRYLPYPPDQAILRYLSLEDPQTFLTFTLHKPWVDALVAGLKERGIHCGYIGGIFGTLLENQNAMKGKHNLCIFKDIYLCAELDDRGNWKNYRSRRLPFADEQAKELDVKTLVEQDLMTAFEDQEKEIVLINFEPRQDACSSKLKDALVQTGYQVVMPSLTGNSLNRFQHLYRKGVTP